ncbi:MAG TPA: hypothetical protein VFE47_17525 [Tepidisphaeraceae bacterium]|nr:hypothetical protein [Tepidisphaeraceae bacterium]
MFRALDGWYGQSAQDYPVRIAPFAGWLKTQIDREANPAVDDLRKRNNLLDNPPQVQQYADDAKKAICTANELGLRHNVSFAKVAPAITWREKLGIFEQLLAACPAADAKPELSQIEFARLSGRSESWISKNRSKIGPFTVENARELREKNDGRKLRSQRSETDAEVEGKFKNTSRQ